MTIDNAGAKAAAFLTVIADDPLATLLDGLEIPLDPALVNEGYARLSAQLVEARARREPAGTVQRAH